MVNWQSPNKTIKPEEKATIRKEYTKKLTNVIEINEGQIQDYLGEPVVHSPRSAATDSTGRFIKMRILLLITIFALSGCLGRPVVEKKDPKTHQRQNEVIIKNILEKANTGDWLVTRGYHATDALVSNVTGIPISHASVYNAISKQVIEAEGRGVHYSGLKEFVDKSYRLLIIRPRWQTQDNMNLAWFEAEKLVGKNYDFLGTIGFNYPTKYYCSELAILIYKQRHKGNEKFPDIIKPGELYLYGTILYDSLPRDEI